MVSLLHKAGIEIAFNGKKAIDGINKTQRSFLTFKNVVTGLIAGKMVKDMAQFGRSFSLMADKTGLSVERLSSLRNAFISVGSGAKGFEKTIGGISNGLQGLAIGQGEFAAKLGMIGISPYTSSGKLKTPDEILYGISDWAAKQKGKYSKEQILYRLRTWFDIDEELGRKLLDGAKAFKNLQQETAKRMGQIDTATKDKVDKIKTKIDELGGTVSNTSLKIVADLNKPLSNLLDWSREIVKVAGDHAEITAGVIAVGALFTSLGALGRVLGGIAGMVVGLKVALGGLALALGGLLGYALGKLLDPLWEKIGELDSWLRGTKDELVAFRNPDGKIDYESLQYWFDTGVINPQKNKEQYKQALHILHMYNPDKYQNLYADMMTDPEMKKEEKKGLWDYIGSAVKMANPVAWLGSYTGDLATASLGGESGGFDIKQFFEFNVTGTMDKATAENTVSMYKDATSGQISSAELAT